MDIAVILAREVLTMFLLILVGVLCKRIGVLDEENARAISNLLLTAVMPVMIVNVFQMDSHPELLPALLACLVFCVLFHVVCIALTNRIFRDPKDGTARYRVTRIAAVMSNCGFMGFPLLAATVGDVGLLYGAVFVGVFNVFSWAWCAPILSGERFTPLHLLRNPGLIGFAVGLVLYLLELRLPSAVGTAFVYLANMNTPLSMLVIGVFLASVRFGEAARDPVVYQTVLLRNLLFPALTLLVLWASRVTSWLPGGRVFALSIMVMVSCATAANAILMPARYRGDSSHGAKLVFASTLATIVTLPAMVLISGYVL